MKQITNVGNLSTTSLRVWYNYFYLHLALWVLLFTAIALYNPPLALGGHVFNQILSDHFHFTVLIGARHNL